MPLQSQARHGSCIVVLFFRFVRGSLSQCIELLYNGRVVQLDDAAGEVVQGVFLRDAAKGKPLGAEGLSLQAGALVHLAVAVLDVAQHRVTQVGQVGADLVGATGDQSDAA